MKKNPEETSNSPFTTATCGDNELGRVGSPWGTMWSHVHTRASILRPLFSDVESNPNLRSNLEKLGRFQALSGPLFRRNLGQVSVFGLIFRNATRSCTERSASVPAT